MNLLNELESILEDDGPATGYAFGICTAHRSPGRYFKIRDEGGQSTLAMGEAETLEEAAKIAVLKYRRRVTMKMPGM